MKLLIVGTGRSGTGYIAKLLTAAGVRCGHENVYTPEVAAGTAVPDWADWHADASWLAVPRLGDHPGPAVWQMRHPVDVVDSLDRLGLFNIETDEGHGPFRDAIRAHRPEVFNHSTPLIRAAHFVVEWSRLIPADLPTYAVETVDLHQLQRLIVAAGGSLVDGGLALEALDTVPNDVNAGRPRRTRSETAATLSSVLPGRMLDQLVDLYGDFYPPPWSVDDDGRH